MTPPGDSSNKAKSRIKRPKPLPSNTVFLHAPSGAEKLHQPPGTSIYVGRAHQFKPYVAIHQYDPSDFSHSAEVDPSKIGKWIDNNKVNWIDVEGLHDVNLIARICECFEIHPLTQEDIVNTNHRPQFEAYPGYFFFSLKMIYLSKDTCELQYEHVSIILKDDVVITFQEIPGDVFAVIRQRLQNASGKLRLRGADYLTYTLLDAIVDGYYQVVENVGDKIEALEMQLNQRVVGTHLNQIQDLKREILFLRKNIHPVRDMMNKVMVEGEVFNENSRVYVRDLADHISQVADSISIFNEMSATLLESYHSLMNNRLNEIFKVLTMISTVFLPLNFLAGLYGMNFEHMPELHEPLAYPIVLAVMLLIALGMFAYFIHKRWIWENRGLIAFARDVVRPNFSASITKTDTK